MGINIEYVIKCDGCKKVLEKPEDGFIIRGEIMVSEVDSKGVARGGLIGPIFKPDKKKRGIGVGRDAKVFCEDDVCVCVLCRKCFLEALGIIPVEMQQKVDWDGEGPIVENVYKEKCKGCEWSRSDGLELQCWHPSLQPAKLIGSNEIPDWCPLDLVKIPENESNEDIWADGKAEDSDET